MPHRENIELGLPAPRVVPTVILLLESLLNQILTAGEVFY